jgi:hypothetical protein
VADLFAQASKIESATQAAVQRGCYIHTVHVERTVIAYGIHDHELETLSTLNAQAVTFFSLASGLVSAAFGIGVEVAVSETFGTASKILVYLACPVMVIVACAFFGLGIHARRSRTTLITRIREESRRPNEEAQA